MMVLGFARSCELPCFGTAQRSSVLAHGHPGGSFVLAFSSDQEDRRGAILKHRNAQDEGRYRAAHEPVVEPLLICSVAVTSILGTEGILLSISLLASLLFPV
jgi:hypothetical protein